MLIRTRKEVKNKQDVQNLVIAIIFRMPLAQEEFTKKDLLKVINYHLKGTPYYRSKVVKVMLEENLNLLYIRNRLTCKNGVYRARPLKAIGQVPMPMSGSIKFNWSD